jgi:Tol biopolymer transport system component
MGQRARAGRVLGVSAVAAGLALGVATNAGAATVAAVRVDLGANDVQANGGIWDTPSISADGRYVAFASEARNLVQGDTNGYVDVFVRDRVAGTTTRVSTGAKGAQANGFSSAPSISADGRYVTFASYASNLVSGDRNSKTGGSDVFLHDMVTGTTVLVSHATKGSSNGESDFPQISGNGRYVAFDSTATNLVANDKNAHGDVFVWDRTTGAVRLASTDGAGRAGNSGSGLAAIDAAGDKVAFISNASNLVAGDTNEISDAFVKNLTTGQVSRVSVATDGTESHGDVLDVTLSADGSTAAFTTAWPLASNDYDFTPDVYVRRLAGNVTTMVSAAAVPDPSVDFRDNSYGASLSASGRYVVFTSAAGDLISNTLGLGSQVYLKDLTTGTVRELSVGLNGIAPNDTSHAPVITPDGRYVAFDSPATNLISGDTNNAEDLFVLDLGTGTAG